MFIPSVQKNIKFNSITIEQFNVIASNNTKIPALNLGFNTAFINTIIKNCTEDILLTNFDKSIIGLQIYLNELKCENIDFSALNIQHPNEEKIEKDLYTFNLKVPDVLTELEMCNYIIQNNITNINTLLLCEIAKHITQIYLNNTDISVPTTIIEKLNLLRKIPARTLVSCMKYIDEVKYNIEKHYSNISKNADLKYNISLLIP